MFVHNALVRSLSHGKVSCHPAWTFPFVSQDLKSSQETPTMTFELPDKMYPTNICTVECPRIRPQLLIIPLELARFYLHVGSVSLFILKEYNVAILCVGPKFPVTTAV